MGQHMPHKHAHMFLCGYSVGRLFVLLEKPKVFYCIAWNPSPRICFMPVKSMKPLMSLGDLCLIPIMANVSGSLGHSRKRTRVSEELVSAPIATYKLWDFKLIFLPSLGFSFFISNVDK